MWKLILVASLHTPHVPLKFDSLQECEAIRSSMVEAYRGLKDMLMCARDA